MADITVGGVTLSDTKLTQDDVDAAWEAIQSECGWHIAPLKTETITLDTNGSASLILPTLKVTNVSQVLLHGVDVTDQVSWSASGALRLGRGHRAWPRAFRSVEVTFTHGYEEIPRVLLSLVRRHAQDPDGAPKQLMAGGFLVINSDDRTSGVVGFSDAAKAALSPYMRRGGPSWT